MQQLLNVIVQNVSLHEGMAGSMRVKNLVSRLWEQKRISLSNLALTHTYEKDKIGKKGVTELGIPYLYIGYQSALNPSQFYNFYKAGFNFLKENYKSNAKNIIYNYGYPDIKNLPLIFYAKTLGYKIVFDIVEDNRFAKKFSGVLGWIRMKSSIILLKQIKSLADGVIVISHHLKSYLTSLCGDAITVSHIPITVDLRYFPIHEEEPDKKDFRIFYGGSFFLGKDGIEYLIAAFNSISAKNPNVQLLLSGKSVSQSEMQKVLDLIGANEKITYLGYLSEKEYFEVINTCDIFCMPRNNSKLAHAGFPFKLGEYLATGKSVIATNVGDVSMYLQHKVNAYLTTPESAEDLETAIQYYIASPEARINSGKNARLTAEKYFSADVISKDTLVLFENI